MPEGRTPGRSAGWINKKKRGRKKRGRKKRRIGRRGRGAIQRAGALLLDSNTFLVLFFLVISLYVLLTATDLSRLSTLSTILLLTTASWVAFARQCQYPRDCLRLGCVILLYCPRLCYL